MRELLAERHEYSPGKGKREILEVQKLCEFNAQNSKNNISQRRGRTVEIALNRGKKSDSLLKF